MHNQVSYDKMFDIMGVKELIIFEDTVSINNDKNGICYGLVRMSEKNRKSMLVEIEKIDADLKGQLDVFFDEFDKCFFAIEDWNEQVPYNDIETAFEIIKQDIEYEDKITCVIEKYNGINSDIWKNKDEILTILISYGLGVDTPNLYEELFDEYIRKEARWKSFRLFRDFSANTEEMFKQYMRDLILEKGMVVCIIDDCLRNGKSAIEISNCIEALQSKMDRRHNIIGLIYSSFNTATDCISNKIYFEFISKNANKRKIQAALTKSAYSYILSKLKDIYQKVLVQSFDEAIRNKNIAYYLSSMADYEGVTNYQVITNWINLLFQYSLNEAKELKEVASVTRLINLLEDEKIEFSREMLNLNTFEAFDFGVNEFREPIASGDIFIFKHKFYILIGQDCDLMNSATRTRKNGISELVSASTMLPSNIDNSVKLNSEYIYISNFRKSKDAPIKTLKIRYGSREFIENQILQLCQFNSEGKCVLNVSENYYRTMGVEPSYYEEMYSEQLSYFKALLKIYKSEKSAIEIMLNSKQSNRLMKLSQFDENKVKDNIIDYKIQRICRLKHPYMLYLYKMYLEYQGRHPFDCMNMSRVQEMQVEIIEENITLTIDAVLTPDRDMNRAHIGNMEWYVQLNVLEDVVSHMLNSEVTIQNAKQYIEIGNIETVLECMLETREKRKIKIMKVEDAVSIKIST